MKPPFLPALVAALVLPVSAQTSGLRADSPLRVADAVPDPAAIRFIPPPPPEPAPEIPAVSATVRDYGTHRVTIARGEPSTRPDIPPPPPRIFTSPNTQFEAPDIDFLSIFAVVTIYDHALSHLKWTDTRSGESFEAWCAWDWELVSPIGELTAEKLRCSVFCLPHSVDTKRDLPVGIPKPVIPAHPELAPDTFAITAGNAAAPLGDAFLEAYRSHLVENRPALEAALAARKRAAADAAAWRAAHPPVPQDTTIWLRPHRGSRYLDGKEAAR